MVRGREIVLKSLLLALFGLGWVGGLLLSKCSPVKKHPSVFTRDTGWGFVPVNTARLRLSRLPGDIVRKRIWHQSHSDSCCPMYGIQGHPSLQLGHPTVHRPALASSCIVFLLVSGSHPF